MTTDPLNLHEARTPELLRIQRAAPLPFVTDLYKRVINNFAADSVETKAILLGHLIYATYLDLKDSQTRHD
jgi:hypothetical protein